MSYELIPDKWVLLEKIFDIFLVFLMQIWFSAVRPAGRQVMEMTVDAVSFSIPEHFQCAIANLFITTVNKNESAHHMTSCLEKEKGRRYCLCNEHLQRAAFVHPLIWQTFSVTAEGSKLWEQSYACNCNSVWGKAQ